MPQAATHIEEIAAAAIAASAAMPQAEPESALPAEVSALETSGRAVSRDGAGGVDSEGLRPVPHREGSAPEAPFLPAEAPISTTLPAAPSPGGAEGVAVRPPMRFELPMDLEQVESDPQKVRAAEQHEAADDESRPKRVRPAPTPMGEETLVQVETAQSSAPGATTPTTTQPG